MLESVKKLLELADRCADHVQHADSCRIRWPRLHEKTPAACDCAKRHLDEELAQLKKEILETLP